MKNRTGFVAVAETLDCGWVRLSDEEKTRMF